LSRVYETAFDQAPRRCPQRHPGCADHDVDDPRHRISPQQLGDVRKTFFEVERLGVTFPIGADRTELDRQVAFIGESEAIGERLATHNSNKEQHLTKLTKFCSIANSLPAL
jgi:hypothetical protein